jgi:hypothetical protein
MYTQGKASVVCAGDPGFDPYHAPLLAYGHTWRQFGFTCRAQPGGLTCRNPRGHGWFLSRNRWRMF